MVNSQELKQAVLHGDADRIAKQHADGKLTARERIAKLLDQGSFVETDALVSCDQDYAGVVTGYGTVQDRPVYVFAQDFTVHGGAMGKLQAMKILKILDLAMKTGAPVVAMCDSAGVRVDEGALAMDAYASVYARMAGLSGVCPMIALILGPVCGGAALIAQLADISIQASDVGRLMVYGPQVVSAVTGETVDMKKLGGAENMASQGGVSLTAATETEAIALTSGILELLPACNTEDAPYVDTDDLNRVLDVDTASGAQELVTALVDHGAYLELYSEYGKSLRTALARIGGQSVGVVFSDPQEQEGELTPEACTKAARFIRFCDCFSLPVVSLIHSRGTVVPGPSDQARTMVAAAQLLYAYSEATTAKVSVITGNAIGQAYVAMGGKANADMTYAWPGAVISALTPEAAVQVLYTEELKNDAKPALQSRAELEKKYAGNVADAYHAAANGLVDDVILPADTRKYVISALEMLMTKQDTSASKKHGNLPL